MNDFTLEIKSKANEIGFEKIGIAEIEPIKNAKANLESWILKGNHASMNWIEKKEKRTWKYSQLFSRSSIVNFCRDELLFRLQSRRFELKIQV